MTGQSTSRGKKGGWVGIVIGGIFTVTIIGVFFVPEYLADRELDRVREVGKAASGEIVRLEDTGNRSNHDPEVEVWVEYTTQEGKPMKSYFKEYLSAVEITRYQPGTRVNIKYDPEEPANIVFVSLLK